MITFQRMSEVATTEMRIADQLMSRGAWLIDERNHLLTPEQQEQKHALQRRVEELAPRVDAGDLTLRAAVDEIMARPYGLRH